MAHLWLFPQEESMGTLALVHPLRNRLKAPEIEVPVQSAKNIAVQFL